MESEICDILNCAFKIVAIELLFACRNMDSFIQGLKKLEYLVKELYFGFFYFRVGLEFSIHRLVSVSIYEFHPAFPEPLLKICLPQAHCEVFAQILEHY